MIDNEQIEQKNLYMELPPQKERPVYSQEEIKHEFDMEYRTMWRKEYEYLKAHGIDYVHKKHTEKCGIPIYKYRKTPRLFLVLAEFFREIEEGAANG